MGAPQTLRDLARVVRSKNSGPFELTFDVMFETRDIFRRVRDSEAVTKPALCALYGVDEDQVTNFQFFEPALALKLTLRRPRPQGAAGETDTFGAQQHAPLLELVIPDK